MSENTENTGTVVNAEMIKQKISEITEDLARTQNKQTWEFEGKTYDLFLANRTGGIGMPIVNPRDRTKTIGIVSAEFMWSGADAFLDRLDIETIDKSSAHDDWTERENESLMLKNARCYSELCVGGESVDFDELGERKTPVRRSREQMLSYRKPVQSDLLSLWLREFHVERWLPEGVTAVDALLSNPEEIFFTCKIGDYHNPRHLLFIKFAAPSDEAIGNYQNDTFIRGQNQEGDWKYTRDNEKRLRFARKYFRSVQGAMLGPAEVFEFDESALTTIQESDDKTLAEFKKNFNPDWLIRLGEELAGAFNLGKK